MHSTHHQQQNQSALWVRKIKRQTICDWYISVDYKRKKKLSHMCLKTWYLYSNIQDHFPLFFYKGPEERETITIEKLSLIRGPTVQALVSCIKRKHTVNYKQTERKALRLSTICLYPQIHLEFLLYLVILTSGGTINVIIFRIWISNCIYSGITNV